jgi:hypothetical protein
MLMGGINAFIQADLVIIVLNWPPAVAAAIQKFFGGRREE